MSGTWTLGTKAAVRDWAAVAQWGAVWLAVLAMLGGVGSAARAQSVLFSDDFSGDLSQWEVVAGTWEIVDGQLRGIGAGGGVDAWIYAGNETWKDYFVETRAWASEETGNAEIVLRSTGHWQNEYRISVLGPGPGNYSIEVYKNGQVTDQVVRPLPRTLTYPADIRGQIVGGEVRLYVNGEFAGSLIDPHPLPAGRFALGVVGAGHSEFDYVTVTGHGCGDRVVQSALGEECDDGNTINTDACRNDCRLSGRIVGTGTPASCTEAALDAALAGGGTVTFNCGPEPLTITLTREKTIVGATMVDGGGLVTLSGGNTVRVFVVNSEAALEVRNLTIADGKADHGGGIESLGTLTVTQTLVTANTADTGGGIFSWGSLTVTNSTIANNTATGKYSPQGGGITGCGGLTVVNSTIAGNTDGAGADAGIWFPQIPYCPSNNVTLFNSILADSIVCSSADPYRPASGHNLVEDAENGCGLVNGENGNLVGVDPMLDPTGLQDNGGPTQTIALLPGSPAINAGDPDVCAELPVNGLDQRGFVRPGPGSVACSIGAYEYYPSPTVTPTPRPSESEGGCTVTPIGRGGAVWWGALPLWLLLRIPRRRGQR